MTQEPERYYTKAWILNAAILVGFVSCGLGAWLVATAESGTPLFTLVGVLGLSTGLLMFYVAWWSKRTPYVVIWDDRIELNLAVFRARRNVAWSELSGLEELKNGNLLLKSPAGPVEIALTTIEKSDAAKVREALVTRRARA